MKEWKKLNTNKKNYILFSHIISILLISIIIISNYFSNELSVLSYNSFLILIFFFLMYFISNFFDNKSLALLETTTCSYIYFIYPAIITLIIYFNSFFNQHSLKIFYIIPIMLFAMNYSNLSMLLMIFYTSLNLIFLNYLLGDFSNLDIDIIYIIMFFWFAWLIGQHSKIERDMRKFLRELAVVDNLTGLPNYAGFQERYEKWIELARNHGKQLTLVFMDIDDFKDYNESFGHQKGDEVLQRLGDFLLKQQDNQTFFARYGGDEF
ncbi:MAG TPA: GGDEF domain-containing protein, partial [Halanaerobiales bacterium]|nr:GGDEF domain-containing protein [Halanaerobiales bacterium]